MSKCLGPGVCSGEHDLTGLIRPNDLLIWMPCRADASVRVMVLAHDGEGVWLEDLDASNGRQVYWNETSRVREACIRATVTT